MRITLAKTALALACVSPVFAQGLTPVPKDDPEMNAAIIRAKQTLDSFLKTKASGESGAGSFVVKVMITRGPDREHVWVWPFRATTSGFEGILRSHPRLAPELRFGSPIQFARDEISDWGYTKDGKNIGYRTMCVILKRDAAARADAKRNGLEYECAP